MIIYYRKEIYCVFTEKIQEKIKIELANIDKEIEVFNLLLKKISSKEPDNIEIRSIASILHSFYNGVEKIFNLILENYNKEKPKGEDSHRKLLSILSNKTNSRDFILSNDLVNKLNDYLGFRHFYRHAYGFQINHKLLKPLIDNLNDVYNDLKLILSNFMKI